VIHIYSEPSQKFALFSSETVKAPGSFVRKNDWPKHAEYLFRPSQEIDWLVELRDPGIVGPSDLRLIAVDPAGAQFLRELTVLAGKLALEDGCNLVFTLVDPAARAKQMAQEAAVPHPQLLEEAAPAEEQPGPRAGKPWGWILLAAVLGALLMFLALKAVDSMRPLPKTAAHQQLRAGGRTSG